MGPLHGITVLELAGIGPGPFCAMMLADMGATVIRIDPVTPRSADYTPNSVLERGRLSIAIDLKSAAGQKIALKIVERADALIESYRPGVAERLGLGPAECLKANPRIVYGRMTGWGQDGPLARSAGHDINYISLTGALHAIGRADAAPVPPLNLVGDFGGGAMFLAFGLVCALFETRSSGLGQVIDASVMDGTTVLLGLIHGLSAAGKWRDERGVNLLDTGAPYYDVYECADGKFVAVGCIEARFFQNMLEILVPDAAQALGSAQRDRTQWPRLRDVMTAQFKTATRDEWAARFDGRDACVTPVLSLSEAPHHPHAVARSQYVVNGSETPALHPAPAPRFSRTAGELSRPAPKPGDDTRSVLTSVGLDEDAINDAINAGTVMAGDNP
jgi:alpha-methylacyl-CoA racemase